MDIMNPQVDGIIHGKWPELCILEDYPDIYNLSKQKHVAGTNTECTFSLR